jgi:alkylation response protein AidB-like acyl-CoA dehydrogenase
MIEFCFTQEHQLFRSNLRNIISRLVEPSLSKQQDDGAFHWDLWQKIAELGLLGVQYSEAYGGSESDFITTLILTEELAKISCSFAESVLSHMFLSCYFIEKFGTESVKERILAPAIRGEKIGAFALVEDGAASDLSNIRTSAKKQGDNWVLSGRKKWVSNGPICDYCVLLANTDRTKGIGGLSYFLVEMDRAGISRGRKIETLSIQGVPVCELLFDDVIVPSECLLGPGQGNLRKLSADFQSKSRLLVAMMACAMAQTAMKEACSYAKDRYSFGTPISSYQLTHSKFAEHWVRYASARLMIYHTAHRIQQGIDCQEESIIAKILAAETCQAATDQAGRILAGNSLAMECPQQRYLRDARFLLFASGCHEVLEDNLGARYEELDGNVD